MPDPLPLLHAQISTPEVAATPGAGAAAPLPPPPAGPDLPDPVFPSRPWLGQRPLGNGAYWRINGLRAFRGWAVPYLRSRLSPNPFYPLLAYLFTDWKCNLDCHYCWANNNQIKGMSEAVARAAIDWLQECGCRVLAIMGGEPMLRPKFLHKVVYYAARKSFFVYLPTNGRLLHPEWLDWLGDAGVATINLAVDCVEEQPGLPKALNRIRPQFEYMLAAQRRYGFTSFLNVNITRSNLDDVRELTQIAHDSGIAIDYHINETPLFDQPNFKHMQDNPTYIRPQDYARVDELVDWIIARQRAGVKMVNSVEHLSKMKRLMRGEVEPWPCRAGQSTLVIRIDGTLAPCFPFYNEPGDWGRVGEKARFTEWHSSKQTCSRRCFSTLNYTVAHAYNDRRVLHWLFKQAKRGFRGVSGGF